VHWPPPSGPTSRSCSSTPTRAWSTRNLAVADIARKAQDSTIVVLSKWDITDTAIEDVRPRIASRLRQRPPVVTVSAKTGRGISRLLDRIEEQFEKMSHAFRRRS
jgi:GTP-binding protein